MAIRVVDLANPRGATIMKQGHVAAREREVKHVFPDVGAGNVHHQDPVILGS